MLPSSKPLGVRCLNRFIDKPCDALEQLTRGNHFVDHPMSRMDDMDPVIITAIIGAAGSIVAAFVSVHRGQQRFRNESSEQHGVLFGLVEETLRNTNKIHLDINDVKKEFRKHLDSHDEIVFVDELPPVRKKPAAKKLK